MLLRALISAGWISWMFCATLIAQSIAPKTFHVQGRITSPLDSITTGNVVAPRNKVAAEDGRTLKTVTIEKGISYVLLPLTEVTFKGTNTTVTVPVDKKQFYETDLPLGLYTMIARGPTFNHQPLTNYARVFRISTPGTVVLNGALYWTNPNCDASVYGSPSEQSERWKNACGGEDTFSLPSKDGTPFQVFIQYTSKQSDHGRNVYLGGRDIHSAAPVFVAYDLFSLEADRVTYDPNTHNIEATGRVITSNESGKTQHGETMAFKFEDGQAVPASIPGRE